MRKYNFKRVNNEEWLCNTVMFWVQAHVKGYKRCMYISFVQQVTFPCTERVAVLVKEVSKRSSRYYRPACQTLSKIVQPLNTETLQISATPKHTESEQRLLSFFLESCSVAVEGRETSYRHYTVSQGTDILCTNYTWFPSSLNWDALINLCGHLSCCVICLSRGFVVPKPCFFRTTTAHITPRELSIWSG